IEGWSTTSGMVRPLASDGRGLGGFAADGERLFVGTAARTVRVFDFVSGQPVGELGGHGRLIAASRDGTLLALGEFEDSGPVVHFWDAGADASRGDWRPAAATPEAVPE